MKRFHVVPTGRAVALGVIGLGLLHAAPVAAQEARADSLEARVRRLEAVVDSLVKVLSAQALAPAPEPIDEVAALRAAAAKAAAEAAPAEAEQEGPQQSRTGNLSRLNPEISVTGDFVGGLLEPGTGASESTALPREFEISFVSQLDPYAGTKIFLSKEEELPIAGLDEVLDAGAPATGVDKPAAPNNNIEVEEGYLYWVGLPGSLGLKAGKFRQELGLYNRWHTHALLEIERPLATAAFLGDDGLIQSGLSLSLPQVQTGAWTHTATLEATKADNKLFDGGTDLSYLGRVQSFWDISPNTYIQLGVNGVTGHNDEEDLDSQLLGVDVAFRWAPVQRAKYRELTLKGAWFFANRDIANTSQTGNGGYGQANFRWNQRLVTGLRADVLDGFGNSPTAYQLVPSISWWQSEWVRLRVQYNFLKRSGFDADHTFLFQTVWAVGPHKHETY